LKTVITSVSEDTGNDELKKRRVRKMKTWVCSVCGYVYEGDEVPDDFICPLCNHGKEDFSLVQSESTKKEEAKIESDEYICTVCGYIHKGSEPPEICPICKVGKENFKKV
jgi:rubrerythrin